MIIALAHVKNRQVTYLDGNREVFPSYCLEYLVFWNSDLPRKTWCHRLVAVRYVHNPLPGVYNIVDHIDGVKDHNWPSNLRWVNKRLNAINNSSLNVRVDNTRTKKKTPFMSYLTRETFEKKCLMYEKTWHPTFREAWLASKAKKKRKFDDVYEEIKQNNINRWIPDPRPLKRRKTRSVTWSTCSSRRNYFKHL